MGNNGGKNFKTMHNIWKMIIGKEWIECETKIEVSLNKPFQKKRLWKKKLGDGKQAQNREYN